MAFYQKNWCFSRTIDFVQNLIRFQSVRLIPQKLVLSIASVWSPASVNPPPPQSTIGLGAVWRDVVGLSNYGLDALVICLQPIRTLK